MVLDQCPLVYQYRVKNHVASNEKGFIYDKRHSINKILFVKVSPSSSLRSPIDRCFRKAIAFFDFKFEETISGSTSTRSLCGDLSIKC